MNKYKNTTDTLKTIFVQNKKTATMKRNEKSHQKKIASDHFADETGFYYRYRTKNVFTDIYFMTLFVFSTSKIENTFSIRWI